MSPVNNNNNNNNVFSNSINDEDTIKQSYSLDNSQEISLHPLSLHPSDIELNKKELGVVELPQLQNNKVDNRAPPYQPPFSRKTFGVKGQKKLIDESNPLIIANQNVLQHSSSDNFINKNNNHNNNSNNAIKKYETQKSKQRDEYTAIFHKSKNSSKSYSLLDVNFINNKGL